MLTESMQVSRGKLEDWNSLKARDAAAAILPCNGSPRWAVGVAARRPLAGSDALLAASDEVWRGLDEADWLTAFATHPRIGERHAAQASAQQIAWSGKEQAAADAGTVDEADELSRLNLAYEQRFGRVFLICATGLGRAEILAQLKLRIDHSPAEELAEAVQQQCLITRLRLRRWLEDTA